MMPMSRDNNAITSQLRGQTSPQQVHRRGTMATPSATGHPIAVFRDPCPFLLETYKSIAASQRVGSGGSAPSRT